MQRELPLKSRVGVNLLLKVSHNFLIECCKFAIVFVLDVCRLEGLALHDQFEEEAAGRERSIESA